MKRVICTLLFYLLSIPLIAQESDSGKNSYLSAENAYRDGQFEKAIHLLEQDIRSYDNLFIPNAYRLLTLCYMVLTKARKQKIAQNSYCGIRLITQCLCKILKDLPI